MDECAQDLRTWIDAITDIKSDIFVKLQKSFYQSQNPDCDDLAPRSIRESVPWETFTDTFLGQDGQTKHGYFRTFRVDGIFKNMGLLYEGEKVGPEWEMRQGNAFLVTLHSDLSDNRVQDANGIKVIYIYPNLQRAIECLYNEKGKMVSGYYSSVVGSYKHSGVNGLLVPRLQRLSETSFKYDPSTGFRISRSPLLSEPYEDESVSVAPSGIPGAGEGLFAKRPLAEGELVCLFNGIRIIKIGHSRTISCQSEDWSDYRLTLDKSIDLDIPLEYVSLSDYCATLGHKACHSFKEKNARFEELYHPRYGHIMSIVAVRPILPHEEILVNYNYTVILAPQWYKDLWFAHLKNDLGYTQEKLDEWINVQVATWGYKM